MNYLPQILLILVFSFLGELLHALILFPIPASIYGMVLLFLALALKIVRLPQVRGAGGFLVSILPLLFVAPIVSLMDCWDLVKPRLLPILVILVVSTLICFAVSGWVTQGIMARKNKKGGR